MSVSFVNGVTVEAKATEGTRARRVRDVERRGVDWLVDELLDAGVAHVFGVPGGTISPLLDALLDQQQIRTHTMRHEATAVFAACGYAIHSEKVGVAYTTSGPGATNAITAFAAAACDGIPLLLLVGEVPRHLQGRGVLQDGSAHHLNVLGMFKNVAKGAWEANDARTLPHLLRRAMALAMSGKKGPVVVTLPLDVQLQQTFRSRTYGEQAHRFELDPASVDDVAFRLERAKRPVLFVGNGMRSAHSAKALLAFAEHTQIPVMTTPKAKGVFPEGHPLALGVFGIGGHVSSREFLKADDVDCVIAIGTSLGDLATDGWDRSLYPSRALIHVDINGAALARGYPADVGVVAPGDVLLDALKARLKPRPPLNVGEVRDQFQVTTPPTATAKSERVSPVELLRGLQAQLPQNTAYTVDSGEHTLFSIHCLRIQHHQSFSVMTGLGAMGAATGLAIGAALAQPDRPVCALLGDGGALMSGLDIADAVAMGLNITFVIFNDGALRMCELGHENVYGRTPQFATPQVDYTLLGRAMGADACTIKSAADIPAHQAGTRVFNAMIDGDIRLSKTDRVKAMKTK